MRAASKPPWSLQHAMTRTNPFIHLHYSGATGSTPSWVCFHVAIDFQRVCLIGGSKRGGRQKAKSAATGVG